MCSAEKHHGQTRPTLAARLLKAPVHLYRWTVRPWLGWPCRHLPTCSDYALEAIDRNGAWRGFWLTLSRLSRCHPFGSAGLDPVPDIRTERHVWMPWRYGRWTGRHIEVRWERADQRTDQRTGPAQDAAPPAPPSSPAARPATERSPSALK